MRKDAAAHKRFDRYRRETIEFLERLEPRLRELGLSVPTSLAKLLFDPGLSPQNIQMIAENMVFTESRVRKGIQIFSDREKYIKPHEYACLDGYNHAYILFVGSQEEPAKYYKTEIVELYRSLRPKPRELKLDNIIWRCDCEDEALGWGTAGGKVRLCKHIISTMLYIVWQAEQDFRKFKKFRNDEAKKYELEILDFTKLDELIAFVWILLDLVDPDSKLSGAAELKKSITKVISEIEMPLVEAIDREFLARVAVEYRRAEVREESKRLRAFASICYAVLGAYYERFGSREWRTGEFPSGQFNKDISSYQQKRALEIRKFSQDLELVKRGRTREIDFENRRREVQEAIRRTENDLNELIEAYKNFRLKAILDLIAAQGELDFLQPRFTWKDSERDLERLKERQDFFDRILKEKPMRIYFGGLAVRRSLLRFLKERETRQRMWSDLLRDAIRSLRREALAYATVFAAIADLSASRQELFSRLEETVDKREKIVKELGTQRASVEVMKSYKAVKERLERRTTR